MVQTTDSEVLSHSVESFYDVLADDYDTMTGFDRRFVHERPFFRLLVERYGLHSVLDAGCGTGFHSLLLAKLGAEVTGVDVSKKMLAKAEVHAREMNLQIRFLQSDFSSLPDRCGLFDAVFCLGNSLAHLLTDEELQSSISAFGRVLQPGGMLFLQTLNYDRILSQGTRIQSVKERDSTTFVRYYEYQESGIIFHLLTINRSGEGLRHSLHSVRLRPVLQESFVAMLESHGFCDIRVFGGISMEEFDTNTSHDLVVLARRADR